jgi:hypothetical protein
MTITITNKINSNNYVFAFITITLTITATLSSSSHFDPGTPRPQLSSCFLVAMEGDSIEGTGSPSQLFFFSDSTKGIFDTLKTCAQISKTAGGIGMHCSNIRATGSYICGTNGQSNGLVPMLRRADACSTSAKFECFIFKFSLIRAVQSVQFDRAIR